MNEEKQEETITHIKGSKVRQHIQKMYKVGMDSNLYGIWSEDSLDRITGLTGAIEYSHDRTVYYLDEDPFGEPVSQDNIIKMQSEGR